MSPETFRAVSLIYHIIYLRFFFTATMLVNSANIVFFHRYCYSNHIAIIILHYNLTYICLENKKGNKV